jgi:hypothetical protein
VIAAIDFGASTTKVAISNEADEPQMVSFGAALDFPTAIYAGRRDAILVGDDAINTAGQDWRDWPLFSSSALRDCPEICSAIQSYQDIRSPC